MKVTISLSGGPELLAKLARLNGQTPKLVGAVLYREAEAIMTRSKQEFVPTDMGALKASGIVQLPVLTETGASVTMGYGGAASKYAVYVHEGTGPAVGRPKFMPPVEVIEEWAKRHGLPEEAAYPIARAIGERGQEPLKYLERPIDEARTGMEARLGAALGREIDRVAGGR